MLLYILRRVLYAVPVLIGVSLMTFVMFQFTPGDPAVIILGEFATPDAIAQQRTIMGLDDPIWLRYLRFLAGVLQGDLGKSYFGRQPVMGEILSRFPSTLELALSALTLSVVFGVSVGIVSATTRSRLTDRGIMLLALLGISLPNYFIGIQLNYIFGVRLGWVSAIGGIGGIQQLILPATTLAVAIGATLARLTRSNVLEVIHADYVRTARAKGLEERLVLWRHILRNALINIVTVVGLNLGVLLGGAVLIESVFARPGLGTYTLRAIGNRDYAQVQGVVLVFAASFVIANLIVDLLYGFLDPRIRYDEAQ